MEMVLSYMILWEKKTPTGNFSILLQVSHVDKRDRGGPHTLAKTFGNHYKYLILALYISNISVASHILLS